MKTDFPHVLSLGAGVQSSTLALMAAVGDLKPMPIAAIFADTQAEPPSVYTWLDWLETQLPYPVIRVTAGNLDVVSRRVRISKTSGNSYLSPSLPVFSTMDGKKGILRRQCTRTFKIDVIRRAAKKQMRAAGAKHLYQWIGISTDEAMRMKPSPNKWLTNLWPLIDGGVSREGCLRWMRERGFPKPPRSACVFCPYHSDAEWVRLRDEEPAEFARAVKYEKRLQASVGIATALKADTVFLHDSRQPLSKVIFRPEVPRADQFGNECEGICGV